VFFAFFAVHDNLGLMAGCGLFFILPRLLPGLCFARWPRRGRGGRTADATLMSQLYITAIHIVNKEMRAGGVGREKTQTTQKGEGTAPMRLRKRLASRIRITAQVIRQRQRTQRRRWFRSGAWRRSAETPL